MTVSGTLDHHGCLHSTQLKAREARHMPNAGLRKQGWRFVVFWMALYLLNLTSRPGARSAPPPWRKGNP